MEYISAKQNKKIKIEIVSVDEDDYKITAFSSEGESMGAVYFCLEDKGRRIWLRKIETYKNYQNQGVGKALIDVLEYFALKRNVCYIEGKFYPENEYAKPFYLKNGYKIYKEDYETFVGKYLDKEEILGELKNKILGYEVKQNNEELSC